MINNPNPIIVNSSFDKLFVSSVVLAANFFLTASAYPSNGLNTLRTPIKNIRKKTSDISEIELSILDEAFRQAGLSTGDIVKQVIIKTSDIEAPISITVNAINSNGERIPSWTTQDAREIMKKDELFAATFAAGMAAIGELF